MSTTQHSTSDKIETGENWEGVPTIKNVDEFREELDEWVGPAMLPDGSEVDWEVEDPHLNGDPTYLRVTGYRKATNTFEVIGVADDFGLKVADCWQLDSDKDSDRICFRLVPKEANIAKHKYA